jgi:hypothetical protein
MSKTRLMQACAGVALAIGVANTADAGLTIDLRLPTGDAKNATVTAGQKVPIDIYAIVTGATGNAGIEGFQSAQGALIGTGTLPGTITPAGDLDEATFAITLPALAPYNGNGAQAGVSKSLTGADPVMDLGDTTNRGADLGDLVVFRANGMQVTSGAIIPDGREFKIGRIEYVVGQGSGEALLNFAYRRGPSGEASDAAALFRQDGATGNGSGAIAVGAPVLLVVPEPGVIGTLALGAIGLLARRRK